MFGNKEKNEFTCKKVAYKGGHELFLPKTGVLNPLGTTGKLIVNEKELQFIGGKTDIKIPVKRIDFSNTKGEIRSRMSTQQSVGLITIGSIGGIASMMKDFFIEIPFVDDNKQKQKPVFALMRKKDAERFQKWIYKKKVGRS